MSNTISPSKFVRKPMYVDAVQITEENFVDIADWCQGTITGNDGIPVAWQTGETPINPVAQYIHVRVHKPLNPKQTQARVGDWLLYTDRGYKVYTDKAFRANFDDAMAKPEDPQMQFDESDAASIAAEEVGLDPVIEEPPVEATE